MTFTQYIRESRDDDSPIGDLAHDIVDDIEMKKWKNPKTLRGAIYFLISRGACQKAIGVLREAWRDFEVKNISAKMRTTQTSATK